MNKTKIVSIIIIIVGVASLVWWSKSTENKELNTNESTKSYLAKTEGVLTAEKKLYDFGTISMKDGNVSTTFQVSNLSSEDTNLKSISTSCMCTVAYIMGLDGNKKGPFGMVGHGGAMSKTNEMIKAGETRNIEVIYDPNAHGPAGVGMIDRLVYLETENGNKLQLEIKANVTP